VAALFSHSGRLIGSQAICLKTSTQKLSSKDQTRVNERVTSPRKCAEFK
jgi:hypothetical protein